MNGLEKYRRKGFGVTVYKNTTVYEKSLNIIKNFVDEVLEGDVERMKTLCFGDITKKYIGAISDPDMFLITQAIYIILWGDIFDLNFENMGPWKQSNKYSFRGDTMNSFNSLIGGGNKRRGFAFRARFFGADKNEQLWNKIEEFYKVYHFIGNFIVIPNRGTTQNGINGARGRYIAGGMRDYFDWFLVAISNYQEKVLQGTEAFGKFEKQLQMNREYTPSFLQISEWEDKFFLKHYFKNGKPELLFKTPLEERGKWATSPDNRNKKGRIYYGDEEYLSLLEDYMDKSKEVIMYRTEEIVKVLKDSLKKEFV